MEMMKCGKCGGSGFLPEYRGISGGKCFACKGSGEYKASCRTWYQINHIFWIKAKTETEAIKKADKRLNGKAVTVTDMNIR
jgi:hypothetical protein